MVDHPHIWITSHRGKAHLSPTCQYCPDDATKKPSDVYPEGYLDVCSLCADAYDEWLSGFETEYDIDGCERCGASVDHRLCEDCFNRVTIGR